MTLSSARGAAKAETGAPSRRLGHEDVALFECFVVPRYLSLFAEPLLAMLVTGRSARVCHVQCRGGYPERAMLERLPSAHVHGCDASPYAVELARTKGAALAKDGVAFDYRVADGFPLPFPAGVFSHAFALHPLVTPDERRLLVDELARLVAPRGQALVAMPLRGSFVEIADLLRECAIKHELVDLTTAVDVESQLRPTDALLKRELEAVGFEYVEVDVRPRTLNFSSGRGFFEDPVARLLLLPELRANLGPAAEARPEGGVDPFAYVRDAIDKYWSDRGFELTVNVGVVSGRRPP